MYQVQLRQHIPEIAKITRDFQDKVIRGKRTDLIFFSLKFFCTRYISCAQVAGKVGAGRPSHTSFRIIALWELISDIDFHVSVRNEFTNLY